MPDYQGDKFYKIEKENQAKRRKSEKDLDKEYRKIIQEESRQEALNRLRPEDSTAEPEFKKGGIVGRGQGQAYKIKTTRLF